jgi:hypothetical protein
MIDGGPGAEPPARLDAWLVTDERAELMAEIRRSAAARGLSPRAGSFLKRGLRIEARAVVHTNHRAYGYRIRAAGHTVVWAPEFYRFRAVGAPNRPHVRGGLRVGSSDPVCRRGRGVFAHIGRPTLRALARGITPPFGSSRPMAKSSLSGERRFAGALMAPRLPLYMAGARTAGGTPKLNLRRGSHRQRSGSGCPSGARNPCRWSMGPGRDTGEPASNGRW